MMLSLYRQREKMQSLTNGACIAAAASEDDVRLIMTAVNTGRPAMAGIDGKPTIVKLQQEGDEALSFEALQDTCLTLTEIRKMREANVENPDEVPPDTYLVHVRCLLEGVIEFPLLMTATSHGNVYTRIRHLFANDPIFRESWLDQVLRLARRDCDVPFHVEELHIQDQKLRADGPGWCFPEEE